MHKYGLPKYTAEWKPKGIARVPFTLNFPGKRSLTKCNHILLIVLLFLFGFYTCNEYNKGFVLFQVTSFLQIGMNFPFEKSEVKLCVADGVGGLVGFSHRGVKVNIFVTSTYVYH